MRLILIAVNDATPLHECGIDPDDGIGGDMVALSAEIAALQACNGTEVASVEVDATRAQVYADTALRTFMEPMLAELRNRLAALPQKG